MSNHDIDGLMRKAFNLPAPPRPVLPVHGEIMHGEMLHGETDGQTGKKTDATTDVTTDGEGVCVPFVAPGDVLGGTPGLDGPLRLSDDLLDTLAAAGSSASSKQPIQAIQPSQSGQPVRPVEPASGIPGSLNKKNWP